jgi:transposase
MISYQGKEIYLACDITDMRKSINGLMIIVESGFNVSPMSGALFMFCNKSRDRIKILEWDGSGFWVHFKRLESGHFKWPNKGTDPTMTLTEKELEYLLELPRLEMKMRRINFQNAS